MTKDSYRAGKCAELLVELGVSSEDAQTIGTIIAAALFNRTNLVNLELDARSYLCPWRPCWMSDCATHGTDDCRFHQMAVRQGILVERV